VYAFRIEADVNEVRREGEWKKEGGGEGAYMKPEERTRGISDVRRALDKHDGWSGRCGTTPGHWRTTKADGGRDGEEGQMPGNDNTADLIAAPACVCYNLRRGGREGGGRKKAPMSEPARILTTFKFSDLPRPTLWDHSPCGIG